MRLVRRRFLVSCKVMIELNIQVYNGGKQTFTCNVATPEGGGVGITFGTHHRERLVLHERHGDYVVAASLLRLRHQRIIDQHLGEAAPAGAGGLQLA